MNWRGWSSVLPPFRPPPLQRRGPEPPAPKPQQQPLGLCSLMPELLVLIFEKIEDVPSRVRVGAVCRTFQAVSRLPGVWDRLWIEGAGGLGLSQRAHLYAAIRFFQARGEHVGSLRLATSVQDAAWLARSPLHLALAQQRLGALLEHFPALTELGLLLRDVRTLQTDVLAAQMPRLQHLHLRVSGSEYQYPDFPVGQLTSLGLLTSLLDLRLEWTVACMGPDFWCEVLDQVVALTSLTALCLLNAEADELADSKDPAVEGLAWAPGLSNLQALRSYEENLCLALPPEVAALPALTALTLKAFSWAEQGKGLCALRGLAALALGDPFFDPEPPAEVDRAALGAALASLTSLRWQLPAAGLAPPGAFLLPRLAVLELCTWAHLLAALRWGPHCRLEALRASGLLPGAVVDLAPLGPLTTLTSLSILFSDEPERPLACPEGPVLARLRHVTLHYAGLTRIPPQLRRACQLQTLSLLHNAGLAVRKKCVDMLVGLKQLRALFLCKGHYVSPFPGDAELFGGLGCGCCKWDKRSVANLALLRSLRPPLAAPCGCACPGCQGPLVW